jgi:peptidoglycan/LPS O-acetylase OafA/YrhL
MGVYIFFVISGFLITTLLLREVDEYGSIRLGRFYLRRAFRILPPVYAYIAVLGLLTIAGKIHLATGKVVAALCFYGNYTYRPWPIDHFWSLGIEEQFYLFWPLALLILLRWKGRTAAVRLAVIVICVCPIIRTAMHILGGPYVRYINGFGFQGRADALMFGCLLAMLCGTAAFEKVYVKVASLWCIFPLILIGVSSALEVRFGNYWDFPIGYTLNGVCISIFLLWCVRNPGTRIGRLLNWKPVTHIGVLSYSIYIWQQLFLNPHNVSVFGTFFIAKVPLSFLSIFLAASGSYYLIERPALRLREHAERVFGLSRKAPVQVTIVADSTS